MVAPPQGLLSGRQSKALLGPQQPKGMLGLSPEQWDYITTESWPAKIVSAAAHLSPGYQAGRQAYDFAQDPRGKLEAAGSAISGMARDAYNAVTLPGDVLTGRVSSLEYDPETGYTGHVNPTVVDRATDLAGMMTLGSGAIPAEKNSLRAGIRAYHGSPNDFDRFSMDRVTSDGEQIFGHGLYFSGSEDVARGYRQPGGALYEVDIGADSLPSLKNQVSSLPEDVRNAAVAFMQDPRHIEDFQAFAGGDDLTQAPLEAIMHGVAGGPKAGSEALRSFGVPGVSYDAPGAPGVKNYVIFDDSIINILRKYGVAPDDGKIADEAARAERARSQGFNIDAFHGTSSEFPAFGRIEGGNARGQGYYFTTDPAKASDYAMGTNVNRISPEGNAGPNVLPVKLRTKKPFREGEMLSRREINRIENAINKLKPGYFKKGELASGFDRAYPPRGDNVLQSFSYDPDFQNQVLREVGYDARIGYRLADGAPVDADIVVFEPNQVRSKFAKFDPKRIKDSDLLASLAGLTAGGAGAMALGGAPENASASTQY